MASRETIDTLAESIRFGIGEAGLFSVHKADLEKLWGQNHNLSDEQKVMLIRNFALFHGFGVEVIGSATSAMFYDPNKLAVQQ